MSRPASLLVGGLLGCAGCGVPLGPPLGDAPANTCNTAADCATGAVCDQGVCVATSYDLAGLRLQISMHGDATFGVGLSYVIDPGSAGVPLTSQGRSGAPFLTGLDVQLYQPISLHEAKVAVNLSAGLPPGCSLPDGSLPAQVTFYRIPPFAGLPFAAVQAITNPDGPTYSFSADLVSGPEDQYDVYIEPQPVMGCPVYPPYFLPGQRIGKSSTLWQLPALTQLSGVIEGIQSVDEWQLDFVEPSRGLVISSSNVLKPASGGATLSATVAWAATSATASPILRLTPIDPKLQSVDPTRPVVYWSLEGSEFVGSPLNPFVSFTLADLTSPVDVTDSIYDPTDTVGVASQLTLQSRSFLDTVDANNASLGLSDQVTSPAGKFSFTLPAANYVLRAVPIEDNAYAITDFPLLWSTSTSSCGCWPPLPLDLKVSLSGTIVTPTGQPLTSTTVNVSPSQAPPRSYLAATHALAPIETRPAATTSDGSGRFSLLLDQGASDLLVEPDPRTNLPWLVRPQVGLVGGATFQLTTPAFLHGTLVDPEGAPVANAQIDAWFPLRGSPGDIAIKIATTSTDAAGHYTLVLPSSI